MAKCSLAASSLLSFFCGNQKNGGAIATIILVFLVLVSSGDFKGTIIDINDPICMFDGVVAVGSLFDVKWPSSC